MPYGMEDMGRAGRESHPGGQRRRRTSTSSRSIDETFRVSSWRRLLAACGACCADPFGQCPLRPTCKLQESSQERGGLLVDFDHRLPWSQDGLSTFENVQALCPSCHADKTRHFDRVRKEDTTKRKVWCKDFTGVWRLKKFS